MSSEGKTGDRLGTMGPAGRRGLAGMMPIPEGFRVAWGVALREACGQFRRASVAEPKAAPPRHPELDGPD